MNHDKVYLKPNVTIEPLLNQWYAWSYLISPATAAMYIANYHLKIMQSFVAAPQIHVAALKNPAMLGGPFINYGPNKVGAIKELIEKTIAEQSPMLRLAEAIKMLGQLVLNEADGYSLEPLYRKIPDILRGYVELAYDINDHPSFRFIDGLLYQSPYYNPSSQSVALTLKEQEDRPFAFSTPRLKDDGSVHFHIPFNSEALRELCKAKYVPQKYGYIKEMLRPEACHDERFSSFFISESPGAAGSYDRPEVRVRYFGHACVLIESKGRSILCDPVISYASSTHLGQYTYADLPEKLDYVLITHNHQDHCMFETLLQLRHKIENLIVPRSSGEYVDPSLRLVLRQIGFHNVREIDETETIDFDGGSVTGLPFLGEHADLNIRTKTAYLITLRGKKIICAADSNNLDSELYVHIRELVENVDVLFLGMECEGAPLSWLYGPLLLRPHARTVDQSRRFDGSDYEKAMEIVERLNPRQVYVYAMGQEPWLTYLTSIQYTEESRPIIESNKLIASCRERGITAERLYIQKEIFLDDN